MGKALGNGSMRIAGKCPVEVDVVNRVAPQARYEGAGVRNRYDDYLPGHLRRIKFLNKVEQGGDPFCLVSMYTGDQS